VARLHIGCTGWGYDDWKGGFYPAGAPASEYLQRYARVFGFTEVDSTYYRMPTTDLCRRWVKETPRDFLFSVKVPGLITHEAKLSGTQRAMDEFLEAVEPIRSAGKLAAIVLQLPATIGFDATHVDLQRTLAAIPRKVRVAVELRHDSWWRHETYTMLRAHGAALVWSLNQYTETPAQTTADFVYARFIGNRDLTRFNRIQRDGTQELKPWAERVLRLDDQIRDAYLAMNNHFMGFAPEAAAMMARLLGETPPDITKALRTPGQARLDA
jgi:uncharacterized protein YecE (DUF72 family)